MNRLAIVVIGRNEVQRLARCLSSLSGAAARVIFVDSGSEDGSGDLARAMGADLVFLDRSTPFTVARARNAGFAHATALDPEVEFVQFVDADSEIMPGWMAHALAVVIEDPGVAVAFGRVREREPRRSLFARLYQAEFDIHFGQSDECGGMAMMRIRALTEAGGFSSTMRGFEDTELSFRFRQAGWRVARLDAEMATHEAAMTRYRQWWQRQVRTGYARGQEVERHGRSPQRYGVRACRSIWFWGLVLPVLALAPAAATHGISLLLLGGYLFLFLRIYRRMRRRCADPAIYAAFCVLGKFPHVAGLTRFHAARLGARLQMTSPQRHS